MRTIEEIFLKTLGKTFCIDLITGLITGCTEHIPTFLLSSIIMNCTQYGLNQVIPKKLAKFKGATYIVEGLTAAMAGGLSMQYLSKLNLCESPASLFNLSLKTTFIPQHYLTYDSEEEIAVNHQLDSELLTYE